MLLTPIFGDIGSTMSVSFLFDLFPLKYAAVEQTPVLVLNIT